MGRGWWMLVVVAACARTAPIPIPPPTGAPGLTVTLVWNLPADLDLYVTDPGLETVYYAMPRTRSGGTLDHDARCADKTSAGRQERAHWTSPSPGRYRVGVDLPEMCRGRRTVVPYRLIVEVDGRVQVLDGEARLGTRAPRVVEVVVAPAEERAP